VEALVAVVSNPLGGAAAFAFVAVFGGVIVLIADLGQRHHRRRLLRFRADSSPMSGVHASTSELQLRILPVVKWIFVVWSGLAVVGVVAMLAIFIARHL